MKQRHTAVENIIFHQNYKFWGDLIGKIFDLKYTLANSLKKEKMKALRILFLVLVTMIMSAATAQTVYNSSGSSCGKIESNGTIRNSSGSSVGRFDSDGTIRNSSGSSIGKIDRDGTIRNSSGSSMGKIESNGTVRNSSGSSIGKIESDGTVRNSSGSSIGKAQGIPKEWAAAFFFFFPFY